MGASPGLVSAKVALRTRLSTSRAARSPADRATAARALCAHLRPRLAGPVAGYVPTAEEPGAGELVGVLGPGALLPVVPASGRVLSWARADGDLVPGRYGLLEPTGPRLPPGALGGAGVVVVPALAVGLDGTRLGRGAGYYDRALLHAAPDAVLVGLVFDEELLPTVPAGAHDVHLHAVVTPSGGWRDLG
ncbi:5-formyltetrahydrofolate cyclo-ligase [Klenkia taihuensis]|uniref:5-formyltetrahydrofolate cyclo-ligase n=1 Tax=Klenkia taihuensis TaxID=1225127 RepID=A0A1I1MSH2_9ACTN|nr:5-formyltetrahydrofolate cyclo-ligase [Klenkia taihuensis]GHE12501.1 5-formyltetrahydrofolate cyclo-ligase [Klenkia taihuensis]SFC88394.1 5-formyltetrahydrofolate cyclo-ligase [Klenkia taihuensis]